MYCLEACTCALFSPEILQAAAVKGAMHMEMLRIKACIFTNHNGGGGGGGGGGGEQK